MGLGRLLFFSSALESGKINLLFLFFLLQLLKKKGKSAFLQRLERGGPATVASQLRVSDVFRFQNLPF